jgi:hypothetical protein
MKATTIMFFHDNISADEGRILTLPDKVWTVPEDCSTDCRNLSTFFQLSPHLPSSSALPAGPMTANAGWAAQSLEVANSARGLSARQVASSLARSAAASVPEVSTSPTRWPGSSTMENARGAFSPAMDPAARAGPSDGPGSIVIIRRSRTADESARSRAPRFYRHASPTELNRIELPDHRIGQAAAGSRAPDSGTNLDRWAMVGDLGRIFPNRGGLSFEKPARTPSHADDEGRSYGGELGW